MGSLEIKLARFTLGAKKRMRIYAKLSRFLSNGVPLLHALETVYQHVSYNGRKKTGAEAVAITQWILAIRNGKSFSSAISEWAAYNEVSLISAGEISGRLDKALDNMIYIYESQRLIKKALFGITYPIFLLMSTFFYLYIFGSRVVPAFAEILPVSQWHGSSVKMLWLANFATNQLIWVIIGLILLSLVIIYTFPYWTGKLRTKIDKIPPWSLYRIKMGCGFLTSFSALLNAGVPTPEALTVMAKNTAPWFQERLLQARAKLLDGAKNIGDALERTGFCFPSEEMIIDIRSYADLDGFEDLLEKLSRQWLQLTVEKIEMEMAILRNAAIVFMGLVFMWIVSGMFSLQGMVSQAAMSGG